MKMYSLTRLPSLLLLLTLWLGNGNTVYAQADSLWQETFTVPGVEHFAVDPLQQLLTVDTDGVMVQYNPQGQALFRYHNTTLGEDFTIDATDPFNILLFYLDQQTVILLDRTLSVRASLDLRNTDILYATAVARSHDNNLWVYDELAGRLYKLSARGDLLFTSNDFRLSENLSVGPSQIVRWGDRIVLNFPDRGLALFSVLGQLQEWWPILQVEDLFFQSKTLYYRQSGSYYRKQILQDLVEVIAWPEGEQPQTFLRQLTRRYLLQPDGVLRVEVQKAVLIDRN
ncbi:MAG: hypothetical protein AAFN81_07535 [Bacteroidota bacterium]